MPATLTSHFFTVNYLTLYSWSGSEYIYVYIYMITLIPVRTTRLRGKVQSDDVHVCVKLKGPRTTWPGMGAGEISPRCFFFLFFFNINYR